MKDREYSFDVLRVIAMVMVIIIHVSNVYCRNFELLGNDQYIVSLIFNTVSRISVPIFFMISGALLLDRKFNKKKYFSRIFRFLLVIVVWDIIYLVWEYFYLGVSYDKLYMLFIEPYRAHLWFLYTIIILYILQPLLKLILDKSNNLVKILLFILWLVLSSISLYDLNIANLFTLFGYIGYFVIGKYLYEFVKNNDLNKYNILMVILLVLSYIESVYLNYKASYDLNMFYNLFFAYRSPFIILASFIAFILCYNLFHNKKSNKTIMIISDVSFGVYLIHGMFLDITTKNFDYSLTNSFIGIILFTLFIAICSILVVYFLRKNNCLKKIL